jgi:hypothetical protein
MKRIGQKTTLLIPTQTEKQPKPKNKPPPQPPDGMGKLQHKNPHAKNKNILLRPSAALTTNCSTQQKPNNKMQAVFL